MRDTDESRNRHRRSGRGPGGAPIQIVAGPGFCFANFMADYIHGRPAGATNPAEGDRQGRLSWAALSFDGTPGPRIASDPKRILTPAGTM